ncbi:MAG TPA: xylan 1,4-beta-xylosidase [Candidatus Mediterraneibacter intestinigallinarum]|nr:xylan 1,4-beta-xylosidase [Candidatus Mediterraneibacter intestinigallinarum]
MERFKKVYQQGIIDVVEIWVDTETGVNYVFHMNGNAAGFTPLLDRDGKPIVTNQEKY